MPTKRPAGVSLLRLQFLWPLSFDAVGPDTAFAALQPEGAVLSSISYSPDALVAFYCDGSAAYCEGGSYGASAPQPLSPYIDPQQHPLRAVSAASLHFVALSAAGGVLSAKNRYGDKTLRQLDRGGEAVAAVAAGTWHALAVTSQGGLLAWAVEDNEGGRAAVEAFAPVRDGSTAAAAEAAEAAEAAAAAGGLRCWAHPGLPGVGPEAAGGAGGRGRLRVSHASAGSVHSLLALSDGSVHVAGAKASQRFSRNMGISTIYARGVQQITLPVRHTSVLLAEACGSTDTCCVATDAGVVCWGEDRSRYHWSEQGWSAEYRPAPRHLPALDGVELRQIALSSAYSMAAALAADGRIFLWCIALSESGWPAAWLQPAVAATAAGALSIGWSGKDLLVAMPAGSTANSVALAPPRPAK